MKTTIQTACARLRDTCIVVALLAAGSAQASTIVVNSFLDDGIGCTLRKAIDNANAGGLANASCTGGSPGSNTIVLGTGTYQFTANPNGPYNLINNSITIQGNGPANTIIDGQSQDYIFDNFGTTGQTAISITLSGLTITHGHSPGFSGFDVAGAMYVEANATATLSNVAFTNNSTTASGGAVANYGNMTVNNATFSGNASGNGTSGEGGAIRNAGTLTVTNSTFNGNSAAFGGAIYHTGDNSGEALNVTNSTFSGNTANLRGGAIAANNAASTGAITLTHVTIANNSVSGGAGSGGGIYNNQSANFSIDRSIIAGNTAAAGPDCNTSSSFNSLDYNVIGSTAGCTVAGTTTNNFVGAALLNALADNGGPTQTISLQAYSPARDRAPTCATSTDQRGTARPLGTACDSGAFEASPTVPQAPTIGTATAGNAQASVTFSAVGINNGGSSITSYTATSNPGGITHNGSGSPLVVTGLTNGTSYTFTVTANNSVGSSAPSAASNAVTPVGPPGAPTIGTATAGDGQASIAFTAPTSNGGSAITGYTATCTPGPVSQGGSTPSITITGLTNGTLYTCSVTATNAIGTGPASGTVQVTPVAPTFTLTVATAGSGTGTVTGTGINCPGDCTETVASGTHVLLTAAAGAQSTFSGWSGGGCSGTGTCDVTVSAAVTVTATFVRHDPAKVDFNGDGHPDLVWSNTANGATYVWYMAGTPPALQSDAFIAQIDPSWQVQAIADFNGDGHPDLVWRNTATGDCYVWYMNGTSFVSDALLFTLPQQWVIQGVADFNGDDKPDFLLRNTDPASGVGFVWFFNDATPVSDQFLFAFDPVWKVEQIGDVNGDGQPDLLFRNTSSGLAFAWYTQYSGGTLSLAGSSLPMFSIDPTWEVSQLADWNADGKPDLLFRNATTGVVLVWYLNADNTLGASDFIIQIDPSWQIVPRR